MSLFYSALFLFLSQFFFGNEDHKFYVSTTTIEYKVANQSLQITSQMFIDDVELLLQQSEAQLRLDPDSDIQKIDKLLESKLNNALRIQIDQQWVKYTYLGREYKNDILQCYLEIKIPQSSKTLSIQNKIFFTLFEEQQNIIHFKNGNNRKSFLLHAGEDLVKISLN